MTLRKFHVADPAMAAAVVAASYKAHFLLLKGEGVSEVSEKTGLWFGSHSNGRILKMETHVKSCS